MVLAVESSKYACVTPLEKIGFSLFQKVSVANSLLVRVGTQNLLPLLSARVCV